MDIQFLESFVMTAQMKSFSKAAQYLHITQPTISARIQSLEKELGVPLFVRKGREVVLTVEGEWLLPFVKKGLSEIQDGFHQIQKKIENKKEIRIRAANPFAMSILPRLLPDFYKRFADVRLTVLPRGYSDDVLNMLKHGLIDMGFANESSGFSEKLLEMKHVEARPLFTDSIVLVTHPQHRFATGEPPHLEQLEYEPVLYINAKPTYWKSVLSFLATHRIELRNKIEINHAEAIKNIVMENPGVVTLLTGFSVDAECLQGRLHIVPVTPQLPNLTTYMLFQQEWADSPICKFIEEKSQRIFQTGYTKT